VECVVIKYVLTVVTERTVSVVVCRYASDHPNKEQYDQYEQQWRQYEEQMSQKREDIQRRKRELLESQQQSQVATAASQPAMPQPGTSAAAPGAPVPPSSAPASFTAPPSVSTSAAAYGTGMVTSQPGYPYPHGAAAGHPYPMSAPGFGGHMPFRPGAPYPPHMTPGAQRFPPVPHNSPAFSQASSGPSGPRPGFPETRPPFDTSQTYTGDSSESLKGFGEFGNMKDGATGSQQMPGPRPSLEAAGGPPAFGQRFRAPRPPVPSEFGIQTPFQQNQPQAGFGQSGPRPGFGPRPAMYGESAELSSEFTEPEEDESEMASGQFEPGFGGPGVVRGVRPGVPGLGPRPGFPRGPRPMGMVPRQQAPGFSEAADENLEESGEWLGDEMQGITGAEFGPRGMLPGGPRFVSPGSGFAGRGDVRGPGPRGMPPRAGDPRQMLRPGDPRAAMRGMRPMGLGLQPPWLSGAGRGVPAGAQNFDESAADEEYDENAENQEGAEEGDGYGEEYDEYGGDEFEGNEDFEQGDGGFGNAGFGPRGFPHSQFGVRPSGFGMERPRFDMRGPRPGFGPRMPGFGTGLRPGPVPLMDIRVRAPAPPVSKEESNIGEEEVEENVGDEETEEFTEESDQFAEHPDAAGGMGPRMPFRPPFPPGPRGFPPSQRLRPPGSMLAAPPRCRAGAPGGLWPRPGFGERFPGPGFRGPMPPFPRMPGLHADSDMGEVDVDTGFGDVSEEDYLAAEAQQWGEQAAGMDGPSQAMKSGDASDFSAERYTSPSVHLDSVSVSSVRLGLANIFSFYVLFVKYALCMQVFMHIDTYDTLRVIQLH